MLEGRRVIIGHVEREHAGLYKFKGWCEQSRCLRLKL